MRYRNINGTELKPSAICMGGGPFCVEDGREHSFKLLDTFCELGGNFVDTANIYGKWLPSATNISELTIGQWMSERGNRQKLIIGTKGAHPHLATMNISRISQKEVEADLVESLKALQTDYVDMYWLHRDDETIPVAYIIDYLNKFVKEGKIRYFGCSNWKIHRIKEANDYAAKNKIMGFVANQPMWSFAVPNEAGIIDKTTVTMGEEGLKFHKQTKIAAIPFSSQANGFYNKLDNQQNKNLDEGIKRVYYNKENLDRFARAKKLTAELSKSLTEVTLGCLISQSFTTIPIVGCHTVEQLQDTMKAGDISFSEDIVSYLESGI